MDPWNMYFLLTPGIWNFQPATLVYWRVLEGKLSPKWPEHFRLGKTREESIHGTCSIRWSKGGFLYITQYHLWCWNVNMYRLYIFIPTQFYHIFHIVLEIHMSSSYISIDVSTLIYMSRICLGVFKPDDDVLTIPPSGHTSCGITQTRSPWRVKKCYFPENERMSPENQWWKNDPFLLK